MLGRPDAFASGLFLWKKGGFSIGIPDGNLTWIKDRSGKLV
jgi:hypothetical protein